MTEEEKEKVSGVIDCQKLTLEACTHAAQNERLPLRAVVQVLFFEQLQLRRAIAGTILAAEDAAPAEVVEEEVGPAARREGDTWRAAVRENQVLRLDMDSMRSRVHELERECSSMRKAIEKIDPRRAERTVERPQGSWGSLVARRIGCRFPTQVCDSHQRTVVAPQKPRIEQSP